MEKYTAKEAGISGIFIGMIITMVAIVCLAYIFEGTDKVKDIDLNTIEVIYCIAEIESGGRYKVEEKWGGKGIMQVSEGVLKEFNERRGEGYKVEDLFNPVINIEIGSWYWIVRIPEMIRYFKREDSLKNRVVAYNAGIRSLVIDEWPKSTDRYYRKLRGMLLDEEKRGEVVGRMRRVLREYEKEQRKGKGGENGEDVISK